jgi:hypothetical protein
MAAIKRAGADRIQKLEGADNGAGGEQFKAEPPAPMSFTRRTKSPANSWKMSRWGQVDWKRSVVVCARLTLGVASTARPAPVAAAAFKNPRRAGASVVEPVICFSL